MVSIKLKFRPSSVDGKAGCLYYRLIYMRKVRQISTNFRIVQSEWNAGSEEISIKGNDSSRTGYLQYVQNQIEYDRRCFMRIVKKLTVSEIPFTVDTVVDEFQKQSSEITLFSYMEKMIGKLWRQGQHRTSETYQAALNSFRKFRGGVDVCFDDIDSEMLISYEYHLRAKELAPNTISFYMKRLRAVYNNAVEDGYADNSNPFKKVFTSSEKTVKRAIPLKLIRKLKEMDLNYSASKSFARDMFLFSFYTRGMSFVDMAYLQKKNLKDNVLTYRRKKTGQLLSIRWEDCMQKIVDRYSSLSSPFLVSIIKFPADNTRKQYHNALTLVNHNLKAIGRELGLTLPLTMYVARHSWASIARDEGIPLSVISEGMGHDSESTTQIYLASLETQVIDKANKKILKLL
ncbi:MAG: site-specific integrase [Clostridium sp.]|nr:site-specific integrase [Bacteroides sp.]MCM1197580.1 site-specific integrase [Clostridium sp.]